MAQSHDFSFCAIVGKKRILFSHEFDQIKCKYSSKSVKKICSFDPKLFRIKTILAHFLKENCFSLK